MRRPGDLGGLLGLLDARAGGGGAVCVRSDEMVTAATESHEPSPPTLRECVNAVMTHQWANTREAMDALTQLLDAASAVADADVLAAYSRSDGRREWVSVGTWLYPGDRVVVVGA